MCMYQGIPLIAKVRYVVKEYRRSALKQNLMRQIDADLKIESRKLQLDVITRWNSTLHMMESVNHRRVTMEHMQAIAMQDPSQFGVVNDVSSAANASAASSASSAASASAASSALSAAHSASNAASSSSSAAASASSRVYESKSEAIDGAEWNAIDRMIKVWV